MCTPIGSRSWGCGTRAAGHDAEAIVDTLVRFSRFPVSPALLLDVTDTVSRYGRLELHNHPAHGLVLVSHDRAVLTGSPAAQEDSRDAGARRSTRRHRRGAPQRTRQAQAGAAGDRLARG